ncbi:AAA family ATPase [Candidatus Micrarchaeota archaeon]|nr:AAA family ATPase [Candidatus Micrarchaeota archaeon]
MWVVGIAGMRASGKGLFSEVAKKLKIPVFEMRDVVYEMMENRGIGLNNRSIRDFATNLRKKYGYGIVAKKLVRSLEKNKDRTIIINGIRGLEEVEVFRKKFGKKFVLLGVYSPPDIRFRRVLKRNKPEDPKTLKEFEWADRKELSWGVAEAIAMSDMLIVNIGKKPVIKRDILDFLRKYK